MPTQAEKALRKAVENGDLAALTRLVEEKVNIEAKDKWGQTALMMAAMCGQLGCLDHLIAKGAKPNAVDNWKRTALHFAAAEGDASCVASLLKAGADASLKSNIGETALDLAKRRGHTEVVKILENPTAYLAAQAAPPIMSGMANLSIAPGAGHLLVSARFGGGQEEKFARDVAAALKAAGVDVYMVSATGGDDFGKQTMRGIARMSAMLAVCFDDYGAMTDSNYSSYYEVKAAIDKGKAIIPLRLSEKWPPVPPNDKDGDGADQNGFVFHKALAYIDGRGKSAADCAALLLQQAGDKMPRSQ